MGDSLYGYLDHQITSQLVFKDREHILWASVVFCWDSSPRMDALPARSDTWDLGLHVTKISLGSEACPNSDKEIMAFRQLLTCVCESLKLVFLGTRTDTFLEISMLLSVPFKKPVPKICSTTLKKLLIEAYLLTYNFCIWICVPVAKHVTDSSLVC